MANYRRTASGNWSTLAEWEDDSGGSYAPSTQLPSSGDNCFANNFVTDIDINIEVNQLRNAGASTTSGGRFDVTTTGCDTIIVNEDSVNTGNVTNDNDGCILFLNGISHELNIFSDFSGIRTKIGVNQCSGLKCNIYGEVLAGGGQRQVGFYFDNNNQNVEFNLFGKIVGGDATIGAINVGARFDDTSGVFNVIGIVEGSQSNSVVSVTFSGGDMQININGIASGLISRLTQEIKIDGVLNAGSVQTFNTTNTVKLKGVVNLATNGVNALSDPSNIFVDPSTTIAFRNWANDGDTFLYTGDIAGGNPQESDVRKGVEYGVNDEFTGELEQVDITGLAEDLLNEIATSSLPLAERLRNCATVQSVGDQFNGFE